MSRLVFPVPVRGWRIDTCHADERYPLRFGRYHSGWDINAVTGGDSDRHAPFGSIYDGEVVFVSDNAGGAWGGLIVVWHAGLNCWSRYGHHEPGSAQVRVGERVKAGQTLARIGKGLNGTYLAHLHLDILKRKPPLSRSGRPWWAYWPNGDLAEFMGAYLDPAALYRKMGAAHPGVPTCARREYLKIA